jgi:mono/diheme cytochrome c family protein
LYALLDVVGNFPPAIVQVATLFATIVGPTLLIVVLIVLPFVDRNPSRRLSRRPWVLGITALVMAGAIGLSWVGQNNVVQQQLAHNIIGPNATVAAAANSSGALQTGPQGTAGSASGSTASGTTPATAGAGATVYSANCAGCHGATGMGVAGQFPPLAGNPIVVGDASKVIPIVLNGLNGSITVKGQTYNNTMPPWKGTLTNKQIADVITYIRNAWGNKASTVTAAQVASGGK